MHLSCSSRRVRARDFVAGIGKKLPLCHEVNTLSGVQTKVLSKRPVIISLHPGIRQLVMEAKSFILRAVRPLLWYGTFGSVRFGLVRFGSVRARSFSSVCR